MSTERIIVDRAVAEPFAELLAASASALPVGDPRDPSTQIGPLINDGRARARVGELVEDARAHGRRGAGRRQRRRALLPADGAARRHAGDAGLRRGVVRPARLDHRVDGAEQAIEVANDTEYGLSAAIFSARRAGALELAQRIQSGICHINDTTVHDEPQMPFGGVKASGCGRFGGHAALEEFTELRWITIQESERHYPI